MHQGWIEAASCYHAIDHARTFPVRGEVVPSPQQSVATRAGPAKGPCRPNNGLDMDGSIAVHEDSSMLLIPPKWKGDAVAALVGTELHELDRVVRWRAGPSTALPEDGLRGELDALFPRRGC